MKNDNDKNNNISNDSDNEEIRRVKQDTELVKAQKVLELEKQGLKSIEEFNANKRKSEDELKQREDAVVEREKDVEETKKLQTEREMEIVKGAELNQRVKDALKSHEIQASKKRIAVKEYAIKSYYSNIDLLFQKILNARHGTDTIGRKNIAGKSEPAVYKDQTVCLDTDFREELKPIIEQIMLALDKAPVYKLDTDEYMTEDEIVEYNPEDNEESESDEKEE